MDSRISHHNLLYFNELLFWVLYESCLFHYKFNFDSVDSYVSHIMTLFFKFDSYMSRYFDSKISNYPVSFVIYPNENYPLIKEKAMKRIQAYLDNTTAEYLAEHAKENDISVSNAAGNIVREYFQGSRAKQLDERDSKTYFLRLINTLNQVLMCVYDKKKTSVGSDTAEECIAEIKVQIKNILDEQYQPKVISE